MGDKEREQQDRNVIEGEAARRKAFDELQAVLESPDATEAEKDEAVIRFEAETDTAETRLWQTYTRRCDRLEFDADMRPHVWIDYKWHKATDSQYRLIERLYNATEAHGWMNGQSLGKALGINIWNTWNSMPQPLHDLIESSHPEGYRIKPEYLPE